MDKIAEQAQVSKRTVYNHFCSKEELFMAMFEEAMESLYPPKDYTFDVGRGLQEQLFDIAHQEIEIMQTNLARSMFRMWLGELLRNPELAELLKQKTKGCDSTLINWFKAAEQQGVLCIEDVELATEQFYGLLKASAFWPSVFDQAPLSRARKKKIANATVDMFLNTYQAV